jgi:hypothetical protein
VALPQWMRMSRQAPRQVEACASYSPLETKSMFKKLVPVIALALIAGPVFAADPPSSSSSDQSTSSSSSSGKSHHKKHKKSTSKSDSSKSSDSSANTPAK